MLDEGSYYHIYNRGNNREKIYFEEENYHYFLKRLRKYVSPHVDLLAYCLMPNHFHLFVRVNNAAGFQKGIKNFFISYVKAINKRYGRVGHLFQGRFKRVEVDENSYYTRMITYIHQNPVAARMVEHLEDYRYSSYTSYLSGDSKQLNRNEVIDWFGGVDAFVESHQTLVEKWVDAEPDLRSLKTS